MKRIVLGVPIQHFCPAGPMEAESDNSRNNPTGGTESVMSSAQSIENDKKNRYYFGSWKPPATYATKDGKVITVLIPLPSRNFDPSEAAVTWQLFTSAGFKVLFATPDGTVSRADEIMLTGVGLDLWGGIPILNQAPVVGRILRADNNALAAYSKMERCDAFLHPGKWSDWSIDSGDILYIPGGHNKDGMVEFLESPFLQALVVAFFQANKIVAAVCHGTLLVARSMDPSTGKSVLYGRKTTALTWALENAAWRLTRWVRWWDPNYYRTYLDPPDQPVGYMGVQQEITRLLQQPEDFIEVSPEDEDFRMKTGGLRRDTEEDERPAHVVVDGNYVSGRWPGDVHTMAKKIIKMILTN